MSNDTAPCGCEGHVENFAECRYPALEAERDGLKARVAELENDRETLTRQLHRTMADSSAAWDTAIEAAASVADADAKRWDGPERQLQSEDVAASIRALKRGGK